MLAGVLESGRDAIDGPQHRLQVGGATRIACWKAAQLAEQSNLEVAHRIDIRIPESQAREKLRLLFEDRRLRGDLQHGIMRPLKLPSDDREEPLALALMRDQVGVLPGDPHVRLG